MRLSVSRSETAAQLRGRVATLLLCTAALLAAPAAEARWFFEPQPAPQIARRPLPGATLPSTTAPMPGVAKKNRKTTAVAKAPEKIPPGPLTIIVSLKQQRLTLYVNGEPYTSSPVSTGVPGHPTPLGVFSVIEKNLHHRSNLYSDAPMPYMQRITWSGVAMHEGKLPGYPASHGCIRLPREFAQRLWGITKLGARVIISNDDVQLTEINNARLMALSPAQPATKTSWSPLTKVRVANAAVANDATEPADADMPLKGSIDANANVESAIDTAVQTGMAEAEAYLAQDVTASVVIEPVVEQKKPMAAVKGPLADALIDPALRPGPISVYVSRKLGRVFVRKGFHEVFDAPVTIAQPDQPLGTHVFTALGARDGDAARWSVVSLSTDRLVKKGQYVQTVSRGEKLRKVIVPPVHETVPAGDPNAALERITIPEATLARITALMSPGASFIISDLGMSHETGRGTDFIVLTR